MRNLILSLYYKYKSWRYEQRCIKYFGAKPEKIYLSQEDYDALVERLNEKPKYNENIARVLRRIPPWEEK
jgi:hypothetical protein